MWTLVLTVRGSVPIPGSIPTRWVRTSTFAPAGDAETLRNALLRPLALRHLAISA